MTQFSDRDLWFAHNPADVTFDNVDDAEIDFNERLEALSEAAERLTLAVDEADEDGYCGTALFDAANKLVVYTLENMLSAKQLREFYRRQLQQLGG